MSMNRKFCRVIQFGQQHPYFSIGIIATIICIEWVTIMSLHFFTPTLNQIITGLVLSSIVPFLDYFINKSNYSYWKRLSQRNKLYALIGIATMYIFLIPLGILLAIALSMPGRHARRGRGYCVLLAALPFYLAIYLLLRGIFRYFNRNLHQKNETYKSNLSVLRKRFSFDRLIVKIICFGKTRPYYSLIIVGTILLVMYGRMFFRLHNNEEAGFILKTLLICPILFHVLFKVLFYRYDVKRPGVFWKRLGKKSRFQQFILGCLACIYWYPVMLVIPIGEGGLNILFSAAIIIVWVIYYTYISLLRGCSRYLYRQRKLKHLHSGYNKTES